LWCDGKMVGIADSPLNGEENKLLEGLKLVGDDEVEQSNGSAPDAVRLRSAIAIHGVVFCEVESLSVFELVFRWIVVGVWFFEMVLIFSGYSRGEEEKKEEQEKD
jgi:hypothetical protein